MARSGGATFQSAPKKDAAPPETRRSQVGAEDDAAWLEGVILGALFRALGDIEVRRLDVLVLFFEGRSVPSLVLALWG